METSTNATYLAQRKEALSHKDTPYTNGTSPDGTGSGTGSGSGSGSGSDGADGSDGGSKSGGVAKSAAGRSYAAMSMVSVGAVVGAVALLL